MINQFCIFPFLQVEKEFNIFDLTIQPGIETCLQKFDNKTIDIIEKIREKIGHIGTSVNYYSIIFLKDKSCKHNTESLNKIANFLRFRISYDDENIDYQQALYIIVTDDSDGSIKVAINGKQPTILESQNFSQQIEKIKGRVITVIKELTQPNNKIAYLIHNGLRIQEEIGIALPSKDNENMWRALDWYSKSFIRHDGLGEQHEVVCLSIAFEALLDLPDQCIGSTFKSYVNNFIGKSENLEIWASEFYNLRSKIVHGENILIDPNIDMNKSKKGTSIYYKPKHTERDFCKSIDIARPIFRDLFESIYLLGRKKNNLIMMTCFLLINCD
jgi:hypothetical protein